MSSILARSLRSNGKRRPGQARWARLLNGVVCACALLLLAPALRADEEIVRVLRERDGTKVARRTVTKYRQALDIPSSTMRRSYG